MRKHQDLVLIQGAAIPVDVYLAKQPGSTLLEAQHPPGAHDLMNRR